MQKTRSDVESVVFVTAGAASFAALPWFVFGTCIVFFAAVARACRSFGVPMGRALTASRAALKRACIGCDGYLLKRLNALSS